MYFETKPDYEYVNNSIIFFLTIDWCSLKLIIIARYLRRNFRELFERSGFVEDGQFDWVEAQEEKKQAASAGVGVAAAEEASSEMENRKELPGSSATAATITAKMTHLSPLVDPAVCTGTYSRYHFCLASHSVGETTHKQFLRTYRSLRSPICQCHECGTKKDHG